MDDRKRVTFREPAEGEGRSRTRRILTILMALSIVGLAVAYVWYTRVRDARLAGDGQLIAAPPGPYKVRPDTPGGMTVEGQGSSQFAASEGREPEGRIDLGAAPEAPIEGRRVRDVPRVEQTGRSVQATVPATGR